MSGGYVLDFSNRTFQEFVADSVGRDIYAAEYSHESGSKANRLRAFWKREPDHLVGRLVDAMIDYAAAVDHQATKTAQIEACRKIGARLLEGAPVPEIEVVVPNAPGRTFESLAKSVRESIENNRPEVGLDRLHTFVVKYVRAICERHRVACDREKPLHSCFGEYVRKLRAGGFIGADMTDRILKSTISILEAFNHVRNNQSLAHDNDLLGYDESLLIFNNVCAIIRYLEAVETRIERSSRAKPAAEGQPVSLPI
jgi:hypothetical protein